MSRATRDTRCARRYVNVTDLKARFEPNSPFFVWSFISTRPGVLVLRVPVRCVASRARSHPKASPNRPGRLRWPEPPRFGLRARRSQPAAGRDRGAIGLAGSTRHHTTNDRPPPAELGRTSRLAVGCWAVWRRTRSYRAKAGERPDPHRRAGGYTISSQL